MVDILHRVVIDAKPDKVFNALTTIEGVRGWSVRAWLGVATISADKTAAHRILEVFVAQQRFMAGEKT